MVPGSKRDDNCLPASNLLLLTELAGKNTKKKPENYILQKIIFLA